MSEAESKLGCEKPMGNRFLMGGLPESQSDLEVQLGSFIGHAMKYRRSAEAAERKAAVMREREAEALEVVAKCRQRLGLQDAAIGPEEKE